MRLATSAHMTITQLRAVLGALVGISSFVAACSRNQASEHSVVGPRLGESTASGPDNPSVPPPDAAGVTETHSGPFSGVASARVGTTGAGGMAGGAPAGRTSANQGSTGSDSGSSSGSSSGTSDQSQSAVVVVPPVTSQPVPSQPAPFATDAGVGGAPSDAASQRILDAGSVLDAGRVLDAGPAR